MNRYKTSMFAVAACLLGLGLSDTVQGQSIVTNPSTGLSFQVQSGGASASQSLTINGSSGGTTVSVTVPANQTWLSVNGNPAGVTFFVNTPSTVTVTANTANLATGQTLSTNIAMVINGLPSSQINYPVALTVGTPTVLSANPATLSFSALQGSLSGSPTSSGVTITSSASPLTYNVSATTVSGGNWLLLSNTSSIATSPSSPGFQVYVNASSLTVGTYSGQVLVQSTSTGDSVTIPVTLSVTAGAVLNVTGSLNNFIYQAGSGTGGFSAETQSLQISTSSGTLNYQVVATPGTTSPAQTTSWLVLGQTGGTATQTPQPLSLSLSYQYVASLSPGTYTINLAISPTGAATQSPTNVTVTLIISTNPLLNVSTRNLSFSVPFGSLATQSQTLQITSSGASIAYTVQSNQPWLTVLPSSGTTASNPVVSVSVNASGLVASTTPYTATLTVYPNNSDQTLYSIPISVSLTVTTATSQVYAGPDQLLFSYQTTQAVPALQLVQLTSTSVVSFNVTTNVNTASNCPSSNWLTATPSQTTTPATLSVSIATSGMTSGFCSGTVQVTYNNGSSANTTVLIPVTVDIAATPLLTVTPPFGFGVVTATYGSTSVIGTQISINSTDGSPLAFTATASTPGAPVSWLYLASSSGTTQQYLQVQISASGLPVGVYNGSITIHATNSANLPSGDVTLPVVLTVSTSTTVAVSPTSLTFTQAQGAATPPASQTIALTATGGSTTFIAAVTPVTGGNWLQITPLSGTASGTVTASVAQNTLSPGTYTSNITLSFSSSATPTVTVPVKLVVTAAQTVVVSSTSLSFAYQLGSAAPASQTINVTSTGGAVAISVGTTSATGWLSVTPTSGSTGASGAPLALTVSLAPASLTTAGTYSGTITITPTGQTAITIPVTVTVTGVPAPQPVTISNSASGAFGSIAPGELITIKGTGIGPTNAQVFTVAAGNTVANTLGGVQVLFDGIPGTPTYVSSTQVNVIVPYEIAGRTTTNVVLTYQGIPSAGISQFVASQAPGIYTFSSTGAGQASVLNQNYTFNGPSTGLVINGQSITTSPAPQGSVIAVYMTGGGQTNPVSTTGTVTPGGSTLYNVPGTVTATINGVKATVLFAGAAPGLVTGVIQVNILVPTAPTVTGSGLPLAITINGTQTLSGPTVSVQ